MSNLPLKKNKRVAAALISLLAIAVLLFAGVVWKKFERLAQNPTYKIPRQIRYSFTLKNTSNKLLKRADFWTYAPVKKTATQLCVNLKTSHPYQLNVDELGNQILHFELKDMPPYSTKIIMITADLLLSDTPNPGLVPNLAPYLGPEKYLESNDPSLGALAKKLHASNTVKTAENIFLWVANNVEYSGFFGEDRGALYALKKKKGDCTEFMYLFAALCRANDIPSRCIAGYRCTQNAILGPVGYHNWAEIYHNSTWQTVDPQNKVFMQNPSRYIAMRILGKTEGNPMGEHHRFRAEGEGLKIRLNS